MCLGPPWQMPIKLCYIFLTPPPHPDFFVLNLCMEYITMYARELSSLTLVSHIKCSRNKSEVHFQCALLKNRQLYNMLGNMALIHT